MKGLKRAWYMAGWSRELSASGSFHRRILDRPLLFFRAEDGRPTALFDRCPHRFAPLHKGEIANGVVSCGYHGLKFSGTGECVYNPHGDGRIPSNTRVQSFAVEDRHGILWVWMGQQQEANPDEIPDFSCLDESGNYVATGYLHVNAHYSLETDNIMDLGHIDYLHRGTLASEDGGKITTAVRQVGNTVWSDRLVEEGKLSPFLEKVFSVCSGQTVDRWLNVRWDPPATMLLDVGVVEAGQPRHLARGRRVINIFSPESETTTHYWFAVSYARSIGPNGPDIAARAVKDLETPFLTEDLPMIESVQAAMMGEDFWSLRPVLLSPDAGAVRARRVLDSLIKKEADQ